MSNVIKHPAAMTDSEILDALGVDSLASIFAQLPDPDGIHLAPGETLADRLPAKHAKGRAKEAARRRAALRVV